MKQNILIHIHKAVQRIRLMLLSMKMVIGIKSFREVDMLAT